MHTEEQGLSSLCTEGHLGQDTADIQNLPSLLFIFHFYLFSLFSALWLINLVQNEHGDSAKEVFCLSVNITPVVPDAAEGETLNLL